jgi:hypothetical protein
MKVEAGPGYRLLELGERCTADDEIWAAGLGPWIPNRYSEHTYYKGRMIVKVVGEAHAPIRRKLNSEIVI